MHKHSNDLRLLADLLDKAEAQGVVICAERNLSLQTFGADGRAAMQFLTKEYGTPSKVEPYQTIVTMTYTLPRGAVLDFACSAESVGKPVERVVKAWALDDELLKAA